MCPFLGAHRFFIAIEMTPRGCGENAATELRASKERGSPPRVRGKPDGSLKKGGKVWITPADAGKTVSFTSYGRSVWDHPRGCGENILLTKDRLTLLGSPPRVRAKPNTYTVITAALRITPASAGKTAQIHHSSM